MVDVSWGILQWAIGLFVAIGMAIVGWIVRQIGKLNGVIDDIARRVHKNEVVSVELKAGAVTHQQFEKYRDHISTIADKLNQTAVILERIDRGTKERIEDHEARLRDLERHD